MLDQRRVAAQPDEKRELLFTERYESLLAWALRLTKQQRESAEDLVQDAFVQFMLGRTRLEEIENIDGYLRRMLRYMYVSRMSRSAQHLHETALSVADYDSCHLGWTAIEPPRRMQAFEELQQICTYACSRKETSRAGSVLILRFFHDYFPTEIAGILNTSRHCVDQWQRLSRRELKLFMNEPGRLRFVDANSKIPGRNIRYLSSDCDLMLELRQIIFASCGGDCLSRRELEAIYSVGDAEALTTPRLAHIVSCAECLDVVNNILGLPLLNQRYQPNPGATNEPPQGPHGGGASGGGASGGTDLAQKFGHKLRTTREHKPQELRIAVNGSLVSSLKVSSELSELNLNLTPDDPVEFVEVSSEQGVQLLFFSIDPAETQSEQWAWIELSDDRFLEASFRNDDGPSLQVVYKDPTEELSIVKEETPHLNNLSSPLFVVPEVEQPVAVKVENEGEISHLRSWATWPFRKLQAARRRPLVANETTETASQFTLAGQRSFPTFLGHSSHTEGTYMWRRVGLLIVLLSALIVAGFLLFKSNLSPKLTATVLLEKSQLAEQTRFASPGNIRHRFINLEERRSAEGAIVARRKIEIWENRVGGDRAQRLYGDSDRLLAGVWQKQGAVVVYHHGSRPQSQPALASFDSLLLNLEDVWQLEPSAQTFASLIADPAAATVQERSTTFVLNYERVRIIGASRLLKATLTLSKSDLHPIEQTLLVQRGGEIHEYRFVEAASELLPLQAVAPSVFEIEPELKGGAGITGRTGDWASRDLTSSRVPPAPGTSTPPSASAELEVDVAYLLNQAKADRNEQVALTRSAGGSLRVEGLVDSQQRKDEFLKTLAPVSRNPAVRIEIRTVAEATQRSAAGSVLSVQETEDTVNTVAADDVLRSYFSTKDPAGPINQNISAYSSRIVNRAYQALFHAIEIRKLVTRFSTVDMRTVAPDARAKWLAMLHEHAAAFARENAVLRQEIQPVFFPELALQIAEHTSIQSDADLARTVERLHKLALSNNDAVRSALTISSHSSAAAMRSAAFWQALERAESFAKSIKEYQTRSN
jgi:RNA polymerase sigma factor (sigma-70 family)